MMANATLRRVPAGLLAGLVVAALAGIAIVPALSSLRRERAAEAFIPLDPAEVAAGRAIYERNCGACHGAALEGQPGWARPDAAGRLPAPPLDDAGHAWQHGDADLLHIIGFGFTDPLPPGYVSDMPAFAGRLSPAAMASVLAYVKSAWPARLRLYQAMLNPDGPAAAPWPADWRFPVSCRSSRARRLQAARPRP